ncbi:hypothetical protein SVIOM74S_02996 [Streptomyces violarus]
MTAALLTRAGLGELITAGTPLFSREAAVALTCYTYWAFLWDDHLDGLVQDPDAAIALYGGLHSSSDDRPDQLLQERRRRYPNQEDGNHRKHCQYSPSRSLPELSDSVLEIRA